MECSLFALLRWLLTDEKKEALLKAVLVEKWVPRAIEARDSNSNSIDSNAVAMQQHILFKKYAISRLLVPSRGSVGASGDLAPLSHSTPLSDSLSSRVYPLRLHDFFDILFSCIFPDAFWEP